MSPYRVAMVAACPFPCPRGTPVRVFRMAEALAAAGHEVHVVTYHFGAEAGPFPFEVHRIPRVPTYRRFSPGPTYQKLLLLDPLLAVTLRRVLSRSRFDLIHAHHYEGLAVALSVRRDIPVVFDAHTLLGSELQYYSLGLSRRMKKRIGNALDRRLPRRADHVIAVTERIRNKLVIHHGLPYDQVSVISNGIEREHFHEPRPAARPLSREHRILVYSGNLASYQGIDLLLRSFRRIVDRRPNVRLLVVTSSPFGPYERLSADLGLREHVQVVESTFAVLPQHLASADVAVHPRLACDGLPLKLLNYMAAGRPVVSFRGSAETLRDGVTGLLVEDGNLDGFAEAVLRLLDDEVLARRLGEAGRAWALSEHSWANVAERVRHAYDRVLANRGAVVEGDGRARERI